MPTVIISDHTFPSLDLQKGVLESAAIELVEINPICVTEDDVIERCGAANALLVQWAPITRRVLQSLPHLKGVVRYGIGVNNIDLIAAKDLGIGVANIPTYCIEEVSNHALAMILGLGRRIPQDHYRIAHGEWGIGPLLPIPAFTDMTLGLIGFGAIARRVAQKARSFGFNIVASDPYLSDALFVENEVKRVELDVLLSSADIISLHCPLVEATTHLINRDTIQKMKSGVVLINTSRGPLVKELDLVEALQSNHIVGAGLDVFEEEPLAQSSALRALPNVILTSHAASVSTRAVDLLQIKAAESARDFVQGKRPESALVWPATV
jgi:D-3-phosphoglycerate dehydrogenase